MSSEVQKALTMDDVAVSAGVNQSTVSRALRGDPKISPEVRKKILQCAKDLGYKPNPYVSAFAAHVRSYRRSPRGAVMALLDCHPKDKADHSNYRFGAETRAREHGFTPEIFHLHELDYSLPRLNQVLWTRSIAGLLILPVPLGFDLTGLDFGHLASSTVDTTLHAPVLHRSETDYFQGIQLALQVLESRGYRRATFCTSREEVKLLETEWLGGFTSWQAIKPRSEQMEPFIGEDWTSPPFKAWFKKHKPDALISNIDLFFKWSSEMGHHPPNVAHICLGAGPSNLTNPTLSGIDQNQLAVGAAAVDSILAQIHRNDYGLPTLAKKILIQGSWFEGKSIRTALPAPSIKARNHPKKVS